MSTTPPGWYDDGRGALRWWDGAQWTEHVQTPDAESAAPAEFGVPQAPVLSDNAVPTEPAYAVTPEHLDSPDHLVSPDHAAATDQDLSPDQAASTPPGYPGGFPGGPAPSGAFISATEPKRSKLWILWVVLGVVLLGIVVVIAVMIPLIIGLFGNSGSASGAAGPSGPDETAAVAAVELYDEAWGTADCDKFTAATTEGFRVDGLQLGECADFISASESFTSSVENYKLTVTAIDRDEDQIIITTSEKYDSLYDEQGELLDTPVAYDDAYVYTVVPSDGGWAIDDLEAE